MKNIEDLISPLVKEHFPAFYEEEGSLFIEFVKSYFKWLEQVNYPLYYSRNLLEYKDVDKTIDSFLIHFKETYLKDFPRVSSSSERILLKNALNFYQNKGDESSVKIALKALFNKESSIYLPGEDVFKSSDGQWIKPRYLEVSTSTRTNSYVNKEILGTTSSAKAFCEGVAKKRINSKYIDVLYLSNVRGNFSFGEKIVETGNTDVTNAPTVTGSLTTLTVVNGGQNFTVGDELNVISENGKNGKAIITAITTETGRVSFTIDDGGWGYSNTANVFISDKVLRFSNLTNSNTSVSTFYKFENISQNLMTVGLNAAINTSMFAANTIIFAQGNSSVSNATAGVVKLTSVNNSVGSIIVTNLSGNIAATNSTVKASLVDIVFNTTSNISLFANGVTIVSSNSTANSSAYVILSSSSNSTYGTLLVNPVSGNIAVTNTTFRLSTNNLVLGTVNTYTSNLYFTANVANSSDSTATGVLIGSNSTHIGVDSVLNTFYVNSIFSYVRGSSSNSYANIDFVSTGSGASFQVGSLDNEESVLLNPDLIGANNTGNIPFVNINLDLSPNNANATGFGFVKYPGADINTRLLDALRFTNYSIGEISVLSNINPGQDYNIDPFVLVYEKDVAGYKLYDFNIITSNPTRSFVVGETIEQSLSDPAIVLTVNTFTGTFSNGATSNNFEINEFVYQSNGSANIATGYVYSTGLSGGIGDVKIRTVTGTFQNTSVNNYKLNTLTSNATANISNVTSSTIATTAYGKVKTIISSNNIIVKRTSFGSTFETGYDILGKTSGAVANLLHFTSDTSGLPIGENAVIDANVQSVSSVASTLKVVDSGFGYLNKENVTLSKSNSVYTVIAQTGLLRQGVGEGYYLDTGGFTSHDKKLHDNDYYQEYSYEIQSKLPFSKYSNILKKILHVAGTRMFGKVVNDSFVNNTITVSNTLNKFVEVTLNSISNSSFTDEEQIFFSNGNSNQSLLYTNTTLVSNTISNNSNLIILEVPDSNNSFVVNREVYSPNANSYTASANLVAKSSNSTANVTILYLSNVVGTFTSSNTISGYTSSNTSNTTTTTETLSHAVTIFSYGNVKENLFTSITIPISNTLGSSLTGTVSVSNSSLNVTGTSTSFNTDFSNNEYIHFTSGGSSEVRKIKTVSNSSHIVLFDYPSFSNTSSTFKKSYPFLVNTAIKMPNASSNAAYANVFNFEIANSTYFTYYLNAVRGGFTSSNTVEGYINSTTTNTYSLTTAINTLVTSNTENDIPLDCIITGISSNTSANISYLTVRIEK